MLVFVITGFQLFVFRLQLICWHHFEYYSLRDLQSCLILRTYLFFLCVNCVPGHFQENFTGTEQQSQA